MSPFPAPHDPPLAPEEATVSLGTLVWCKHFPTKQVTFWGFQEHGKTPLLSSQVCLVTGEEKGGLAIKMLGLTPQSGSNLSDFSLNYPTCKTDTIISIFKII